MPTDNQTADVEHSVAARLEALSSALAAAGTPVLASEAAQIADLVRARDDLLRIDEVKRRTGLSTSEIYRREAASAFPRARQIGLRVVAWYASDINAWIKSRPVRLTRAGEMVAKDG